MCEIAKKAFGRVYVSLSECIFANLAFEEHIFRNHDVEKHGDVMMIWRLVGSLFLFFSLSLSLSLLLAV